VWQEACTLHDAGYVVSIICPVGKGYEKKFEIINGIAIWRYRLPLEASGARGYAIEYSAALFWTFLLSWRVLMTRASTSCMPATRRTCFFSSADSSNCSARNSFSIITTSIRTLRSEVRRRDFFYRLLLKLEHWTFRTADVSIATNESYRRIAVGRGGMPSERVFVVRSGPSLERLRKLPPDERSGMVAVTWSVMSV